MVVYEVLGDSNISRSWKAVASDSDRLKGSVLRPATTLVLIKDNLRTVAQTTKYLLISALSNPVSRIVPDGTDSFLKSELCALYEDILDALAQTLNNNPGLQVFHFIHLFATYTCL